MIKSFRSIALLEGLSLLALLFFAMPMKYIGGNDIYVKNIGMAHGVLFILYIAFAILIKNEQKWSFKIYLGKYSIIDINDYILLITSSLDQPVVRIKTLLCKDGIFSP